MPSFQLGRTQSALANIPADKSSFPVSLCFREMLEIGVQNFILDSQVIRQPSPPGSGLRFEADGSNLPWVINPVADFDLPRPGLDRHPQPGRDQSTGGQTGPLLRQRL
jgi:hypothetical protein